MLEKIDFHDIIYEMVRMVDNERKMVSETPYIAEWDYDVNGQLDPHEVPAKSKLKVGWICKDCGGRYETQVKAKTSGRKCPYCVGHKALAGFNDLATVFPDLCSEWDFRKNSFAPTEVTFGSGRAAYWKCKKCGSGYSMRVSERTNGHGCPYCRGLKALRGYNDLLTKRPDVAKLWDYEKNDVEPSDVTASTHKAYYWKCDKCGHSWKDSVNRRVYSKGCPMCINQLKVVKVSRKSTNGKKKSVSIVVPRKNITETHPELLLDWDYEKNTIEPSELTAGSGREVFWHCHKCGARYEKKVIYQKNDGCGFCKGRKPTPGKNDLATLFPEIAKEWNYEKNGNLRPDAVTAMNTRKVWWICSTCGHEWRAYIENRTRDGNGCPSCRSRTHTSFPEQAIFFYMSKLHPDSVNGYRDIFETRMELDIFVPSKKVAIEYDGMAWHKNHPDVERDKKKYSICKKNGIKLIRIVEGDDTIGYCDLVIKSYYKTSQYAELDRVIKELLKVFGEEIDIDTRRDEKSILEAYLGALEKESIATIHPEVCKSWDYEKNGTLKPTMFKPTSGTLVSWICPKCGVSYNRKIVGQVHGLGLCSSCTKEEYAHSIHARKLKENGSLSEKCPFIASQWDYEKNGDLSPDDVTEHSSKVVWWKCPDAACGRSWKTSVSNRTGGAMSGCPSCHQGRLINYLNHS